ncbi:MAG TPA: F0F1 ATP synthase subunit A [Planctomycetota bacterium]|nr:F0F1 ATP synthase subunit A [Planctomycetota bacterium]
MRISPDSSLFGQPATGPINDTIVFTWVVMALMAVGSWLVTRRLSTGPKISRWQNLLEVIVQGMRQQIREVSQQAAGRYLPFVGSLFLFIAVSNLLGVVPGFRSPTGSLSTTTALALCVFVAVPLYGIAQQGVGRYLKVYLQPSPFMLPFNIIGEASRTLALAVRLFGNVMSGAMIGGILLAVVPIVIPTLMDVLGLLTGMIQAYIFAILAMVYIASGTQARRKREVRMAEKEKPDTEPVTRSA